MKVKYEVFARLRYDIELILWAEGKPSVTLFEYKAVRQTGRDPTWNVLRVLSEKNVFFF